jgi:Family of unknown function (DUF6194)
MSSEHLPTGPDRDAMIRLIRETWPDAVVATIESATFFSLDEKHWPNFATVVWTDEHDEDAPSNLSRPGVYRLNIGVGKETFRRLVGDIREPDYAGFDRVLPHPVYAKQRWIAILNPSEATVRDTVLPLLAEAHDRLYAQRARQRRTNAGDESS